MIAKIFKSSSREEKVTKKLNKIEKKIRNRRESSSNKKKSVIRNKIIKGFSKVEDDKNLKEIEKCLANPKHMQSTYLNPSFLEDHFKKYIKSDYENDDYVYDDDDDKSIADDTIPIENKKIRSKKDLNLPIKLVITEITKSNKYKSFRRKFSPVLKFLPNLKKEFGMFHTALIIGPWYLEWTDSSLIIPRKLYSSMAFFCADIENTGELKNKSFDYITHKIARVVCKWNTKKTYCNVNIKKKKNLGNCQEFVEEVMQSLGIKINKEGAFGKYLDNVKSRGQCEMVFEPSKEFIKKFKLVVNSYKFKDHVELDNFVMMLKRKDDIAFVMDFPGDYKVLKSFDRAFWLRHFKRPSDNRFRPSIASCPFDDPRKTKSYMVYS